MVPYSGIYTGSYDTISYRCSMACTDYSFKFHITPSLRIIRLIYKAAALIFGFSGTIKMMKFKVIDFFWVGHQTRNLTEFYLINIFFLYSSILLSVLS